MAKDEPSEAVSPARDLVVQDVDQPAGERQSGPWTKHSGAGQCVEDLQHRVAAGRDPPVGCDRVHRLGQPVALGDGSEVGASGRALERDELEASLPVEAAQFPDRPLAEPTIAVEQDRRRASRHDRIVRSLRLRLASGLLGSDVSRPPLPSPAPPSLAAGQPSRARVERRTIQEAVLEWYGVHGRSLHLRTLRDPYAIWVGETMSQQTQMARVEQALPGFLERFPTVVALAAAPAADVLRAWAGLGYNRRALDLWRAARETVSRHDARLPSDPDVLRKLPGIGAYTARAVAATAFGSSVTALDTNTRRVLGRVLYGYGARGDPGTPPRDAELQTVADAATPPTRAAEWNHALMDLGALVCRPRPACAACPITLSCRWHALSAGAAMERRHELRLAVRLPRIPFEWTRRWLRGRIVDDLRNAPDSEWVRIEGDYGHHDREAIEVALAGLERDGLIERDAVGAARLAR